MWIRSSNHIAIRDGGKIAHLEAVDVYNALDRGLDFNGKHYSSPEEAGFSFSPLSRNAEVELFQDGRLSIRVTVDGMPVDFVKGHMLDQIITDEWHYIENADVLNMLFEGLDITNGEISPVTYMELLRRDYKNGIIKNHVEQLDIPLDYKKPEGLTATLYEYQKRGFSWMDYMLKNAHGCILGDEMGLGKTLQAIALIEERKGGKCLVIAPVSLLDNLKNECAKFAPSVKVLIHHGSSRTGKPQGFEPYDLVVTSYGHAVTDNLLLCMCKWELVILDEAQNIKNPRSARTKRVKDIPSKERLAVTGTPFENHVTDVWSLTDYVIPGFLGTESGFDAVITDDLDGAKRLEPLLSAIMVRRLVKDVANDLPEKIIIPQAVTMPGEEADRYEEYREAISPGGSITLGVLTKLRMFCTHPSLTGDICNPEGSMKYRRCMEIMEEIFARNEKVIIFTSYQGMFDIFQEDLPRRFGIRPDAINGFTPVPDRQKIVDSFNAHEGGTALILNPRAAGVGLNITSANHVIHYNLEWNPALEDQASARAYRRGQTKTTFIYRLYYPGTVEEIINDRLERKRDMAAVAVVGVDGTSADMQDIIDAMKISPKGGKHDY